MVQATTVVAAACVGQPRRGLKVRGGAAHLPRSWCSATSSPVGLLMLCSPVVPIEHTVGNRHTSSSLIPARICSPKRDLDLV